MLRSRFAWFAAFSLLAAPACSAADKAVPFDEKKFVGWKLRGDEKKNQWTIGTAAFDEKNPSQLLCTEGGGDMVNLAGGVDLISEAKYGDLLVEIEVMVPKGSNSGIYLMGEYEIQVLDSYGKEKVSQGDMGAIYSTAAPKVNASKKPGEWQKFAIDFQAPRFEDGKKVKNGLFIKVTLNDTVIHENVEVTKSTGGGLTGKEVPTGPLMFQGDHGPVAFRNLKITERK